MIQIDRLLDNTHWPNLESLLLKLAKDNGISPEELFFIPQFQDGNEIYPKIISYFLQVWFTEVKQPGYFISVRSKKNNYYSISVNDFVKIVIADNFITAKNELLQEIALKGSGYFLEQRQKYFENRKKYEHIQNLNLLFDLLIMK